MRNILTTLIIVSTINNVLILKWHYLSDLILPLECATRIVALMIANDSNFVYSNIMYLYIFGIYTLMSYNDKGSQMLIMAVTFSIHVTFGQAVVYLKPFGTFQIIEATMYIMIFCITASCVSMSLVHLGRVHNQLDQAFEGHKSLLNGMHEGLVIFESKGDSQQAVGLPMLFNKSARKILKRFVENSSAIFTDKRLDDRLITNQCFTPIRIVSQEESLFLSMAFSEKKSLEEIILA